MLALFLANGITLLATLGKGQIDAYGLLFLLLGVLLLTERRYIGMALLFGMALLVKPNVLLLAVPLFLLLTALVKVPLVFLTAPSRLFMYYYSVYLIGYAVLFYSAFLLTQKKAKGSKTGGGL